MGIFMPVVIDESTCSASMVFVAYSGFSSTGNKSCHSLHEMLMYPPKIYWPTRTIVTVGPLLSQSE